ncbi:hypothetical protein [Streptomyces sp. NBC_01276]|uniref:hypothetical protein n=1 Tax=Streptomyces sp. NBC_01276 TaxID=2903808 RepID=UPI00352E154B
MRAAGFVALLTVVFLVTNTAVAAAADGGDASGGGLLSPLDIHTREGALLSGYQLEAVAGTPDGVPAVKLIENGGVPDLDVAGQTQRLVLSGLFTLVRLLVGLCCWLLDFVFKFPLLTLLTNPAQRLADAYERHVVGALGLTELLLAWAFVFGLILFVRGKVGTGLGEIVMTLVIAALATSALIRPDYLLGRDGPLAQTHQAAIEVAAITTSSYFDTPARGARPCDSAVGPAHEACVKERAEAKTVTGPIQNALTDALVVKPYMLLQYGRILDPKAPGDAAAYKAHVKWVQSGQDEQGPSGVDLSKCKRVVGPLKQDCERSVAESGGQAAANPDCKLLFGMAKETCKRQGTESQANPCAELKAPAREFCEDGTGTGRTDRDSAFSTLVKELDKAGPVGSACADYAVKPSWDRVWSVIALLVAVVVVTLMIVSMAVVMLGAQASDAATAAAGPVAWVWAMLPGPSRMVLWRWLGVFVVSALVSFMAAMALPLFGIGVDALLSDSGPELIVERLLLVDALAVAFLIMHRRILAATASFGQRMATRMRYSKIGGTHLRGDSSELGAALAMNGPAGGGGGGLGRYGGPSAAHSAFGARLRSLGSLASLTDGSGMPMASGRLLGDALAEGRRGIAPLAMALRGTHMALRGAHTALIGPRPGRHPAAARLHHAANGALPGHGNIRPGAGGAMVVDQWTGEILHDPDTDPPLLGSRVHARASRLRGYRIASRSARLAYGATLGLPRNIGRAHGAASQFTEDARTQLRVASLQVREDGGRWADGGRAVRDRVDHTGQALATAWQVHDPIGSVRDAAIAAAIHTAPLHTGRAGGPRTTISRLDTAASAGAEPARASAPPSDRRQESPGQPRRAGARGESHGPASTDRDRLLALLQAPRAAGRHPREDGGQ